MGKRSGGRTAVNERGQFNGAVELLDGEVYKLERALERAEGRAVIEAGGIFESLRPARRFRDDDWGLRLTT
jgi:hypothetical protein